jgi:Cu+-exporting ATPase
MQYQRGSAEEALMTALAVLLISCPCALGIATPTAIWVGLGRAASLGIPFRNGEALEALARVSTVAFDKTGTLTTGEPKIASILVAPRQSISEQRVIALAAGLAAGSNHLLARSIVALASDRGIPPESIVDIQTIPGRGLIGHIDEATIRLGSVTMMAEAGVELDELLIEELDRIVAASQGLACVSVDGRAVGVFAFTETLRLEAREAMGELARQGSAAVVLTGDHARRGAAVAAILGVTTIAELTPQEKVRHIHRLRAEAGVVAMVGDGLNDAPALAAADVGIAMGCGADITREAADVCLLGNDLNTLPIAIQIARKTVRTIKSNLCWAFVYNVVGISLAMTGRLNPIFAAGAMVLSSLFVLANSQRLHGVQLTPIRPR